MTDHRVWHASRDAYHCTFRFVRLLVAAGKPIELERLRILDMFLLYPPLLHRSSMPDEVRRQFRTLQIPKPDQLFLRLPSAAAVFQDLRLYQNSAVAQLTARGLASATDLKQGLLVFNLAAVPEALIVQARERNRTDGGLTDFLVGPWSGQPLRGSNNVYRKIGLPARGLAA